MKKYFVSRQCYFGLVEEERYCVEIAEGGLDYANADMLSTRYPDLGEGKEYVDPREAVKAAIDIAEAWAKDAPTLRINIGEGFTMGMTMPFEGKEKQELLDWAEQRWEETEKCPICSGVIEGEYYHAGTWSGDHFEADEDLGKFCTEHCAEKGSFYTCDGCGETFTYTDKRELSEVQGELLCPVCRLAPCAECGITKGDHDDEEHEFEDPEFSVNPYSLAVWRYQGTNGVMYKVVFPDNFAFDFGGNVLLEGTAEYEPATSFDEVSKNRISAYGTAVAIYEMPATAIQTVLDKCIHQGEER